MMIHQFRDWLRSSPVSPITQRLGLWRRATYKRIRHWWVMQVQPAWQLLRTNPHQFYRGYLLPYYRMSKRPLMYARYRTLETRLLVEARQQHEHEYIVADDPLITVCMTTWNRSKLLTERALPSVLAQTYQNFEIIIVGDHCTDDTEAKIQAIGDPRIRFINFPERSIYPMNKRDRHAVAGTPGINLAFELAQGKWLTILDDAKEWYPHHLEDSLRFAQQHNLEWVWSKVEWEIAPNVWSVAGSPQNMMNITLFMRSYLRFFKADIECWKYAVAGDTQRERRLRNSDVRRGFLDAVHARMSLRPAQTQLHSAAEDREELPAY